jgi:hypothetical protein
MLIGIIAAGYFSAQNDFNFPKDMLGKWRIETTGNEKTIEFWTKINENTIDISNYKIFASDTINITQKKIIINNNSLSLHYFDLISQNYLPYHFDLQQIEENIYSFRTAEDSSEVKAFNYMIKEQNSVYFYLETIDDDFFNVEYLMFRDE